ncbi:transporter substrate-binding domain-containing protein [Mesorhizobium yinganensis]|uniref:transporter substrate-binding domain-containing protein n=1 Tax=Mesorhizobium yinganensis TaxID=3157707 RepID=UPI0032B783F6
MRRIATCIVLALALMPIAQNARPQNVAKDHVVAGVFVNPPFVMEGRSKPHGMAVDLWTAISAELGLKTEFRFFPTVGALIDATARGEIDIAVANLSITQKRAERVDFTFPWYDSGQRVLIDPHRGTGFWNIIEGLSNSGFLRTYLWLILLALIAAVLLTIFDRRYNPAFPRGWLQGFAESFYAVMAIISGRPTGRKSVTGSLGRIWQGFWLVFGVATVAFVTSSVTSVMTTLSLSNQIAGISDLSGKLVGVSSGSVSEEFAQEQGFDFKTFQNIEESIAALREGTVAAVIGDSEVLEYYDHTHIEQRLAVVGAAFEPDKYAFALPHQSPLTRPVALTLLGLQESDVVDDLRKNYFGEDP